VRHHLISLTLTLAILGCGGRCDKKSAQKEPDSTKATALAGQLNNDVPMLEMRINRTLGEKLATNCVIDLDLANDAAMIAGYHDVQKLPRSIGATAYGPEVHVYACPVKRSESDFQAGTVVAIVQLLDGSNGLETYRNLGLEAPGPGFYCLHVANPTGQWSAAMTRIGDADTKCPSPTYSLLVSRTEVLPGPDEYPDAAVRIVDFDDKLPVLGVPCVAQWCEIGAASATYEAPGGAGMGAQERVKGWQDEQAVGDKEGGGALKRGARARIIPQPGISNFTSAMYRTAHPNGGIMGVKVATVLFVGAPVDKYRDTWGLLPGRTNVWMRRAQSAGVDTVQVQFTRSARPDPNGTWFLVKHAIHNKAPVPSTARWLWDPNDETIWLGCEQGCCEVTDGLALAATPASSAGSRSAAPATKRP
jgi:hypothetical protein